MAEILETLGNNGQLGKALYELLGQIATSAALKANEKDRNASSPISDQTLPVCKSVPISRNDGIVGSNQKAVSDDESGKSQKSNNNTVSSLGRPRYQWHEPETGGQRSSVDLKKLYTVYVGHLPNDITEGELNDLFGDVGDVVNSFVFPPTNGHTYTYGFVRFYTLEEAENAVREKNLKVIGNKQINVELSSSTRRDLQANSDGEDSKPLMRKEYPKVQRRSDDDEKQVIGKLKASIRRLNSSHVSTLGDHNPDEVFENIKIILRMLINFPMSLTEPSADTGEDKPSSGLNYTSRQTLSKASSADAQLRRNSCGEVANQQPTVPRGQTTSRLPSFALNAATPSGTSGGISPPKRDIPLIAQNIHPSAECANVTNKVRELLDSSSGEDIALPNRSRRLTKKIPESKYSQSGSSTDDERNVENTAGIRPSSEHYSKLPTLPMPRLERPLSTSDDTNVVTQVESNKFSSEQEKQKSDSSSKTALSRTECASRIPSANFSSNFHVSMRQAPCDYTPTSASEVFESKRLSANSREQVYKLNQQNSTASNHACVPSTSGDAKSTSPEHHMLTGNGDLESGQENRLSQNGALASGIYKGEVRNHLPSELEWTGSHSSRSNPQFRNEFSIHSEGSAACSDEHLLLQNGKFGAQFKKIAEKDPFLNHGTAAVSTDEKGIKSSPGRRVLAPSFSFPSQRKNQVSKVETHCSNFSVQSQCDKPTEVMINGNDAGNTAKNDSLESAFGMSGFDFGLENEDDLSPSLAQSAPESHKTLLESNCPSDDVETIKLKDQLSENVQKLEELQQAFKRYPQRRRKRLPDLFDHQARGSELERQIHDAEIFLQKTEEMWAARSNERELAYEKEMFHSTDSSFLLSEFAREIKKDSLRHKIRVTDIKSKILQLKTEQCRREEDKEI